MADAKLREKLAHIDQMLAEHGRKRREIRLAPWQLALTGVATGAGLVAATTALVKIFG